ncbi:MAG TPA: DHA2 family efflux MFS transporter permease subunit [Bacteroidia bacterium]|jgi:DHA2 family multidrug resistance protein|nr:DHA2 family efflux MFS transporter permease subunit [Bacteroidia bacterium]
MAEVGAKKWIITITVIIASLLELIDVTIVNVSLPQIMGNLGATLDDVGWVVTSYAVANVIILPMSGWLGQYFGRRNYYIASIILFVTASFFCGHAHSLPELVIFRIMQGLAGGGLLSPSQAILLETWPREEMGMATALFGLGAVFGPTVGPTIGGFITDHFSWPWIFYVNLPVGALATFLAITFIKPDGKPNRGAGIDWWGILFLVITVGSMQVVLERGDREDWLHSTFIVALMITAIVFVALFVLREVGIENPVVNFKIMRHRSFSIGMFTSFMLGFAMYVSVFVFPIYCQSLLGFSALQTGELLFPGGIATICMMPFVGTMLKKGVPAQFMSTIGMMLFFVFSYLMANSNLLSGTENFFWPLIIRGIGMSLLFVPLTTLAMQDLQGKELGQGAGLNNMMRQLGGSFGVAISTVVLNNRIAYHRNMLIQYINPYSSSYSDRLKGLEHTFISKGYSLLDAHTAALKAIDGTMTKQVLVLSYNDVYLFVGAFMLCCIPFLYLQKFKKNVAIPTDAH